MPVFTEEERARLLEFTPDHEVRDRSDKSVLLMLKSAYTNWQRNKKDGDRKGEQRWKGEYDAYGKEAKRRGLKIPKNLGLK